MEERSVLTYRSRSDVLWVTLNAPPLNLQTLTSMDELEKIIDDAAQDSTIRTLVLTGAGNRVFCAGSDVKEFPRLRGNFVEQKLRRENEVFSKLAELPFFTVAAMNGSAMGGGYEVALCCDVRILSRTAKIGLPEINLGNFPGSGGPMRLTRLVGPARAFELMTLGNAMDAETALKLGLVNELADEDALYPRAQYIAERLATLPNGAAQTFKELIYSACHETGAQASAHGEKAARALQCL